MEKVIANKDFDEVEDAFKLYTIMREERQLVNTKYMLDEENEGLFAIENLNLTQASKERLQAIRERKTELMYKLSGKDINHLKSVAKVMKDDTVSIFTKA
jgi:uncharacterized protein YbcI